MAERTGRFLGGQRSLGRRIVQEQQATLDRPGRPFVQLMPGARRFPLARSAQELPAFRTRRDIDLIHLGRQDMPHDARGHEHADVRRRSLTDQGKRDQYRRRCARRGDPD